MNPLALMAAISKGQQNGGQKPQTSREMTVNGEMINLMMAQSQGQKMDEIRRMSGAQVHISEQTNQNGDRLITLSGAEESILLAQFLIQSNVDIILKEQRNNQQPPQPPNQPPPQNSLYPTNQFDPSIMQQNYDGHQYQDNYNNRNYRNREERPFRGHGRGRRSPPGDRRGRKGRR